MLNTREKLIELLKQAPFEGKVLDEWWWEDKIARIADYLVVNGVTVPDKNVGKWIPVTERLPEKDGKYLVNKDLWGTPYISTILFAKVGEKVSAYDLKGEKNVWYDYDSEPGYFPVDTVTHWMPLPEPPKGE